MNAPQQLGRHQHRSIRRSFDSLGPWYSQFEVDGKVYGGQKDYRTDPRIPLFFSWFPDVRTILELSSYEGGHSLELAGRPTIERLVGLEGRVENIARAEYVNSLLGRGNITFVQADLDSATLDHLGRFDVAFCAGLLYHLQRPWHLLHEIGKVTDRLFLDTHYAAEASDVQNGFEGAWFQEGGYDDPLSGLSTNSFWLTLQSLQDVLSADGFTVTQLHDHPDWDDQGPRVLLAAQRS